MLCNEALSVCRQYVAAWLQLPVHRDPLARPFGHNSTDGVRYRAVQKPKG